VDGRFQILSLDGGGIKGLFTAAVLAHLEEDFNIKVTDYFDLIVGTSTGGIIALALGAGKSPLEVLQFYVKMGSAIFPLNPLSWLKHLYRNKYDADPLEEALKDCLGDGLLGDSFKRLVVPAYNIGDDDVYLFKTPHHERLTRDYKVPMWKVAMATSAAPTYFPSFRKLNHLRLVDGGVWANNPTLVGIAEAVSMLAVPLNAIHVFSIGTTDEVKARPKRLDEGGLLQWSVGAVDVIMQAQSIGINTQTQHLLGKDRIVRMNPKVPDKIFKLDRLSEKELLAKAAHESRQISPLFKELFLNHKALDYKPLHVVGGHNA
jgi:patatin-like phospholipase/acyl hydrolase